MDSNGMDKNGQAWIEEKNRRKKKPGSIKVPRLDLQ